MRHFFTAQNEHGLHSPFVFDLYLNVIKKDTHAFGFQRFESLSDSLRQNQSQIVITDFGAGSLVNNNRTRKISDIAKNSAKSPRLRRLLYRLIRHFGYETIFDLGTSLGLTTVYLAQANEARTKVVSFEGCPATAKIAQQNFERVGLNNIEVVVGNLDETLIEKLKLTPRLDFAFFDANHRYEPTVRYFEACLARAHNDSLFVFDDIHWSPEMEAAWQYIRQHPSTTATLDLFSVGLVFFRKQQPKQNFVFRWPFWE